MSTSYIKLIFIVKKKNSDNNLVDDIWKITYDKIQDIFKCENNNKTIINMKNVENFINIWTSNMSIRLGQILEGYACIDLILNDKNSYSYKIFSRYGNYTDQEINSQLINRLIGTLKDIEIE